MFRIYANRDGWSTPIDVTLPDEPNAMAFLSGMLSTSPGLDVTITKLPAPIGDPFGLEEVGS